jgi:hypothetical protein
MKMNSWLVAVVVLATCSTAEAAEKPYSATPIAIAIKHGQCETAGKLINPDVGSNDRQSAFIAGRLLDEGVCMQADPATAAHFFARAAELGDRNGLLEFATKVGLGVGAERDYERAGTLCRAAGVDPHSRLSNYSLGYACTVGGIAGKLLRQTLPTAAFTPASGAAARVEFTLATRQIRVLATSRVTRVDPDIGSLVKHSMVDADKEIASAWRDALAVVPPPDAARLDGQAVELPLDVDMTLEVPRESDRTSERNQHLFRDDVHGATTGQM